jgi:transposase-like protein
MMKNMIQFQPGLSLTEFLKHYATEEQCRAALYTCRWRKGFECPNCGHHSACKLSRRDLYQCNRCHHQSSVTAGTIFQGTKLPLSVWFLGIYFVTQNKNGISSLALSRLLGVSQNAAWRMKHKLMQVMLERDNEKPLQGRIEMDDSYWGGKRRGGKRGRGAEDKEPFVAAVQTTEQGQPLKMKLSVLIGFQSEEIGQWSQRHLLPGSTVVSDGLACFNAVTDIGCEHEVHVVGGGAESVEHPAFRWVNTMIGNVKNALHGTYHAVRAKHLPRYLAEFHYRFNRRYDLPSLIPRFLHVAVRTPPMPQRLLTMAEARW